LSRGRFDLPRLDAVPVDLAQPRGRLRELPESEIRLSDGFVKPAQLPPGGPFRVRRLILNRQELGEDSFAQLACPHGRHRRGLEMGQQVADERRIDCRVPVVGHDALRRTSLVES
jgi:hypothetical protein